jgi:hypothetical protein
MKPTKFRRKLRLKADAGPHARGHRQDDVIGRQAFSAGSINRRLVILYLDAGHRHL